MDVTVCTATIPPRRNVLARAIRSVAAQERLPEAHVIQVDVQRLGGPDTLDRAIRAAETEFVAILDDDDELLPNHLSTLCRVQEETGADLVYPHFRYSTLPDGGHLERWRGVPWDNSDPHQVPITWLARRELLLDVGGFSGGFDTLSYDVDDEGNRIGYDFHLIKKLCQVSAEIVHVPEVTWIYHVGDGTLGMPNRWNSDGTQADQESSLSPSSPNTTTARDQADWEPRLTEGDALSLGHSEARGERARQAEEMGRLSAEVRSLTEARHALGCELAAVLNSRSWRVTAPLRLMAQWRRGRA